MNGTSRPGNTPDLAFMRLQVAKFLEGNFQEHNSGKHTDKPDIAFCPACRRASA